MIQLTDIAVEVNNETVAIVPNSLEYTEGRGEQKIRPMSTGGGAVEQVFANDLETNMGMVKFSIPGTIENIALALSWKTNKNANVVGLSGSNADGDFTRTFTQAALTGDYNIPIGTEADIEIEFHSNQPI